MSLKTDDKTWQLDETTYKIEGEPGMGIWYVLVEKPRWTYEFGPDFDEATYGPYRTEEEAEATVLYLVQSQLDYYAWCKEQEDEGEEALH